jgi:transposase
MSRLPIKTKNRALKLRLHGYSIKEIADKLHISKSTSSLWVRDVKLNERSQKRLERRRLLPYYKSAIRWRQKREKEKKENRSDAVKIVKGLKRDINHAKIYCSLLYWCEGGKGYYESVRFVNSDPVLIKTFLMLFRKSFQIDGNKLRVLMHLHSYHDEKTQKDFWSNLTKIPKTQFNKTFLKPNTKKRIRDNYPGCVAICYHDRKVARILRAIYKAFSERIGA